MYVWRGTKPELMLLLTKLGKLAAGSVPDRFGIGRSFRVVLGYTLLADIHSAFVDKTSGATDAMGIKWPPLSPSTIAQRKVGPKDLLNATIKNRQKIFDRERKKLYAKYLLTLPAEEAHRASRRVANLMATKETGLTKVETLGYRMVKILWDMGLLANSLTPGQLNDSNPTGVEMNKMSLDGSEYQIFVVEDNEIVLGSDRPYCGVHQHGSSDGKIPRRQFLPDDATGIPQPWLDNMTDAAARFMVTALDYLVGVGSGASVGLES